MAIVILSEAKDLKMQGVRILRSFGVFAPQDDAAPADFSIFNSQFSILNSPVPGALSQ
jgi:hypothetical protein